MGVTCVGVASVGCVNKDKVLRVINGLVLFSISDRERETIESE